MSSSETLPIFSHSGNFGDLLFSLLFVIELLEHLNSKTKDFTFNIQINQPGQYCSEHPYGNVMMTRKAAKFIQPLIESLGFKNVTMDEELQDGVINLSLFRYLKLNFSSGDLRSHYYELVKFHLPQNYSRNIFNYLQTNKYPSLNDKVLLIHTSRYNNAFVDLKELKKYQDKLLFIGLKSEYEAFQKEYFELNYLPCKDALELALMMKSACGVIGNQSGLFSLAEMLKVPRILITAEYNVLSGMLCIGPCNVNPQGGYFDTVRTHQKLIPAMYNLLNKRSLYDCK